MNAALATVTAMPGLGVIGLAGALGVGMIFTHAGISKLQHKELLAGIVANYRLLPEPLVAPVARVLPLVELALGLALLADGQRAAVLPAALLLLAFAGAMAINIRRGRTHIDCGCGRSQLRQTVSWPLVWRNLALVALVLPRLLPAPGTSGLDLATAIAGGAGLFLTTLLFNAIGSLSASPLTAKRS
ncbi:hypothetical protein GCM10009087_11490 [Sphingomonas oligophenolica]|uniref:Methylamine utilization protein MauE n=1 Tax=Sphingomonas oligophenolica TaxID=301154 RepID=A0ABU9Y418_9SPHN